MNAGIESLSFYSSHYFVDLKTLAEQRGLRPDRFYKSIGQEKMAVPPPDEDIITLAANAAHQALQGVDKESIDTVLFATESAIDQSKAGGIYVHHLLDLPHNCRVVELKQACYSGVGGLQLALPYVLQHPDRKVLLVASDIARYGLGTVGEPTQGAGAAAVVLSTHPSIMELDLTTGMYTEDVMDFWRPNYRDAALVDGKYSVKIYLKTLTEAWKQFSDLSGTKFSDFSRFAYHLPFSRMGETAHKHLAKLAGDNDLQDADVLRQISNALVYNRIVGNTYTASVFIALASLLENEQEDLSGSKIGMFSYGSGCVGEFFSGTVQSCYRDFLHKKNHDKLLKNRQELSYAEYSDFYSYSLPTDGGEYETPVNETGKFRFAGLKNHQRQYERLA
ncbi:MAG: hydroxymethylglutaryl-CoA synthase [Calditrichaeota bacterium]|nr:hydroxymethylglutaryl-CoA synthase [Calditrichota bacterium]